MTRTTVPDGRLTPAGVIDSLYDGTMYLVRRDLLRETIDALSQSIAAEDLDDTDDCNGDTARRIVQETGVLAQLADYLASGNCGVAAIPTDALSLDDKQRLRAHLDEGGA